MVKTTAKRFAVVFVGGLLWIVAPPGTGTTAAQDPSRQANAGSPDTTESAYHLEVGSFARQRIVTLGRDLIVEGEARSHAVALDGSAHVTGSVEGDLIVLGGDVTLGASARIGGDVYVLGGRIQAAPGADIGGRSVAYPEASDLWVTLLEGPALGQSAASRIVIGAKLALLAFWTLVLLLIFATSRRELLATSEAIREQPFRNFFVGLTGVAAMMLTALFFSAFAGALLSVPLLVLVAVVALLLRFWGMVAVFHALGCWLHQIVGLLLKKTGRVIHPPVTIAFSGLLALGVIKLLPYLGVWAWSVATFIGVGAALTTKFGRQEAWFES
ncbi:MAG: polymer-forming cytoskeletal protein [Thermoanaerobaculia bacterium]|nr:polymer-forming cytoskeletal protein [Thermoanaerobaculia bacterium]